MQRCDQYIMMIHLKSVFLSRLLFDRIRYQELAASGPDALNQVLEGLYETGRLTAFKVPPEKDLGVKP
jgi:hypothetical protein